MDIKTVTKLGLLNDTPAYIFDTDAFASRAKAVRQAFPENVGLCYSIKANPFLLKYLPDVFDKIEVCSPGELTVCEKTGADMKKVIFSGVNKTENDVSRAFCDGVGVFTAESIMHLELINSVAVKNNAKVPVLLRLTAGSQFGMDEEDVLRIVKNRNDYPGVEITGLHFFSGTQKKRNPAIEKELLYLDAFCESVFEKTGFKIIDIEYGTGLAVDYFSPDSDKTESDRLNEVSSLLKILSDKYRLTVEMGRFFAACCGYYFTKVIDEKTNKGINYAIVDGGLNQLKYDGQLQGMQLPPIYHIKKGDKKDSAKWTLCGSLCTTADVLAREAEFSGLEKGDILVFMKTGAYSVSEGMALFLSRELPSVSLYSEKSGFEKVREIINTDIFNTP